MHLQQVSADLPTDDASVFHAQQYHTVFVDEGKGIVQDIFRARLNALYGAGTAVRPEQIGDNIKRAMGEDNQDLLQFIDKDLTPQSPFSIFSAVTLNVPTQFKKKKNFFFCSLSH